MPSKKKIAHKKMAAAAKDPVAESKTSSITKEQKEAALEALLKKVEDKSSSIEHLVAKEFPGWFLRMKNKGATSDELTLEKFCQNYPPQALKLHDEDTIWPKMQDIYRYAKAELLKIRESEK